VELASTFLDRLAYGLWIYLVALFVLGLLVLGLAEVGLLPSLDGYEIVPPHFLVVGVGAIAAGVVAAVRMRRR
jgi:hypothetical protein